MWYSFMMYVVDKSVAVGEESALPELNPGIVKTNKYPCIVFGYTTVEDLDTVLKDRRSLYAQFKNHKRYYKDYMEVFKYVDKMNQNGNLTVNIRKLGTNNDKNELLESMYTTVIKYRLFYGSSCKVDEWLVAIASLNMDVGFSKVVVVPKVMTSEEKRKISRKRYEDKVRDTLREKSKNYYATHKEELAEKRRIKRQESKTVGNNPLLKKLDSIDE